MIIAKTSVETRTRRTIERRQKNATTKECRTNARRP